MSPQPRQPLRGHAFGFVVALAVITGLSTHAWMRAELVETPAPLVVDIGIEHTTPLSFDMDVNTIDDWAIVEMTSSSDETIYISLPASWSRREVWNVPLNSVISESPSFGFVRWTVPPNGGVSFDVPEVPSTLLLHNPSSELIKLRLTLIDLPTETVAQDVLLIKDGPVSLW